MLGGIIHTVDSFFVQVVFQVGQAVQRHVAVFAVPCLQKGTVQVGFVGSQSGSLARVLFSPGFPFRGGTNVLQILVHDHDGRVKRLIDALAVHGDLRLQLRFLLHGDVAALSEKQTGEEQSGQTDHKQSERGHGVPHGNGDAGHLEQDECGDETADADAETQPEPELSALSSFGLFSDVAFPDPHITVSGEEGCHVTGRLDHVGRRFFQAVADILFVILIQQAVQLGDHGLLCLFRGACRRDRLQQPVMVVFQKMKHRLHPKHFLPDQRMITLIIYAAAIFGKSSKNRKKMGRRG